MPTSPDRILLWHGTNADHSIIHCILAFHRKECMLCTHEVRYASDHNDTDAYANCICMTQACMAVTAHM